MNSTTESNGRQARQSSESVAELLGAASAGDVSVVQRLFESGADLNAKDLFGNTALIYAAAGGHLDLVRWLITHGAEVGARNQIGMTALQRAETQGHPQIVSLLKRYAATDETERLVPQASASGAGVAALLQAARDGDFQAVRTLLARGADANAANGMGWTALMLSTLKGHREIVRLLLTHDLLEVNARNQQGWTALRLAVSLGDGETVRVLLAAGAETDAPDHDGVTPLMQAAGEGNLECLEILLAQGADIWSKNRLAETASEIAAHKGFTKIVAALEKAERKKLDSVIVESETGASSPTSDNAP